MVDSLRAKLARVRGVVESPSMFSKRRAFWVNGKEIAHLHGRNEIDLRLTRALIRSVKDPRVEKRASSSDWVEIHFTSRDHAFVLRLFRRAVRAHLPPKGTRAKSPPRGKELERRRRFH